jgi:hypothetical protein
MNLLQSVGERYRATQCNHWVTLSIRRSQAGDEVGDTGSGCCDRNTCFTGHSSDAARDECSVLLMAADDCLD